MMRVPQYNLRDGINNPSSPFGGGQSPEVPRAKGIDTAPISEAFNSGVNSAFADYRQFTEEQKQKVEQQQKEQDTQWAFNNAVEFQSRQLQTLDTMKQQAQPGAPGFADSAMGWFNTQEEKYLNAAPNHRASQMFKQHTAQLRMEMMNQSIGFEAGARAVNNAANLQKSTDTLSTDVLHHPELFEANLKSLDSFLSNPENGLSTLPLDKRAELEHTWKNQLAISAIQGEQLQAGMDPLKWQAIQKKLDSGYWDKYLETSDIAKVEGKAYTVLDDIKEKTENKMLSAARYELSDGFSHMQEYVESIEQTNTPLQGFNVARLQEVAKLIDEKEGYPTNQNKIKEFMDQVNTAKQVYSVLQRVQNVDPATAQNIIGQIVTKKPGEQGYIDQVKLHDEVMKAWTSNYQTLAKNPVKTLMDDPNVQAAFGRSDVEGYQTLVALQRQRGIPMDKIEIFDKDMAKQKVSSFNSLPPDQVANAIGQLEQTLKQVPMPDGNGTAYDRALIELRRAGLNPSYDVIAYHKNEPVAHDLAAAIQIFQKHNLKEEVGTEAYNDMNDTIAKQFSVGNKTFMQQGPDGARWAQNLTSSMKILATYYMKSPNYNLSPKDAAAKAVQNLYGTAYSSIPADAQGKTQLAIPNKYGNKQLNIDKIKEYQGYYRDHVVKDFYGTETFRKVAEQGGISPLPPAPKGSLRESIEKKVEQYSKQYNIDPNFIKRLINFESGFNPNAYGKVQKDGDRAGGLLQMMTPYARSLGLNVEKLRDERLDVDKSLSAGIRYLSDRYHALINKGYSEEQAYKAVAAGHQGGSKAEEYYLKNGHAKNIADNNGTSNAHYIDQVVGAYHPGVEHLVPILSGFPQGLSKKDQLSYIVNATAQQGKWALLPDGSGMILLAKTNTGGYAAIPNYKGQYPILKWKDAQGGIPRGTIAQSRQSFGTYSKRYASVF